LRFPYKIISIFLFSTNVNLDYTGQFSFLQAQPFFFLKNIKILIVKKAGKPKGLPFFIFLGSTSSQPSFFSDSSLRFSSRAPCAPEKEDFALPCA